MKRGDRWLIGLPLALTAIGVIMVYSSSAIVGITRYQDPDHFLMKQLLRALLGAGVLAACARIDLRRLEAAAVGLIVGSGLLLVAVSVVGHVANGAARQLRMGLVNFQPTDFARIATVVFLAWWLKRRPPDELGFWRGVVPVLGVTLGMAGLIVVQPNLSSAALIVFTGCAMLFLAGARVVHLAGPVLVGAAGGFIAILSHPYQMSRVKTFLAQVLGGPVDTHGPGWQLDQSLIAIGSGGWFGRGLGGSLQKYLFLPEAHTDFIFSILAEELGFVGSSVLLGLFALLLWRGLRTAARATDEFARLLAGGLIVQLGLYALVNLSVATGLAPTTGLPLPFVSYGGSALLANLAAAGLLYRVSRVNEVRESLARSRWSKGTA